MHKEKINKKIAELQEEAQNRINIIVKQDPVWQNIQGQIGAYEAVLSDGQPKPEGA